MGQEIERKFLTRNENWRGLAEGVLYRQGYLKTTQGHRVRVYTMGTPVRTSGYIEITSASVTLPQPVYEFAIPIQTAIVLLENLCIQTRQWEESGITYREGDLSSAAGHTIRFRIAGKQGFLTIKTKSVGISRSEFEFELPIEATQLFLETLCDQPQIQKYRHKIPYAGAIWEVDEFLAENQGLILAEVELTDENQTVTLPDWIGEEVSQDPRYYNSSLVKNPFTQWN